MMVAGGENLHLYAQPPVLNWGSSVHSRSLGHETRPPSGLMARLGGQESFWQRAWATILEAAALAAQAPDLDTDGPLASMAS